MSKLKEEPIEQIVEPIEEKTVSYRVKTLGFSEIFLSLDKAQKMYERIKTRRIRNEDTFSVKIEIKENMGPWRMLAEAVITDDFYDNED